jgi:acyl carrier protein
MSEPTGTVERVCSIIAAELDCRISDLHLTTSADDVDGWDSLAHARLIMAIEDRLNVRFPGDKLFELNCVGDLVNLVDDVKVERKETAHGNA